VDRGADPGGPMHGVKVDPWGFLYLPEPDSSWMGEAACRGMDPDVFFPPRGGTVEPARQVCAGCPVSDDCLSFALEHREKHGIWGGLSENERKRLRRRATGKAQHTHCAHGHALTPENVRSADGRRKCRMCERGSRREYVARLKRLNG
jgi:WhiB family redox-sensing transcriptional regulator